MSGRAVVFRKATAADLPAIVALLADDALGAGRERPADPLPPAYGDAFAAIERQPDNDVIVAEVAGSVVGCLQLTLICGLSRFAAQRVQIEGVRVARSHRGTGVGEQLVRHAIAIARQADCRIVQLTTDRTRDDALRFYERLGCVRR